jgi:hypothetical protein
MELSAAIYPISRRWFALRFYYNMWQPFRTVHVSPVPWRLRSYILDFPFFAYRPDPRLWLRTTAMAYSTSIELGGRPNAIKRCDESCVSSCRPIQRTKRDRIYRTDAAALICVSPTQPESIIEIRQRRDHPAAPQARVDDDLHRSGLDCWLIGLCKAVAWPVQVFECPHQSPQILEQTFWKPDNPVQPFHPPWVHTTNITKCKRTN